MRIKIDAPHHLVDLVADPQKTCYRFAGRVWNSIDAEESRQLVDHYLRNLGLSRVELAVTALKCLYARDTTQYFDGDHAYALMGLLRLRPEIDKTDSAFQAFAR